MYLRYKCLKYQSSTVLLFINSLFFFLFFFLQKEICVLSLRKRNTAVIWRTNKWDKYWISYYKVSVHLEIYDYLLKIEMGKG